MTLIVPQKIYANKKKIILWIISELIKSENVRDLILFKVLKVKKRYKWKNHLLLKQR
jgi:hypothetical protein